MVRPDDQDIRLKPVALIGLMLALGGSNVASMLYTTEKTQPEIVRPDPFTGTEGRMLADRINAQEKRIDALRADINLCLQYIYNHKDDR